VNIVEPHARLRGILLEGSDLSYYKMQREPRNSKVRKQLGDFLRARRDLLKPEDFGLPMGQRRRAPGLRREEAAQLCGISPTWFTWIEQGRTTAVSVPTLAAIARGLKLSRAERGYLFELAARADPSPPAPAKQEDPQRLQRLVDAVRTPAYMLDRHWDAVAWNKSAAELFTGWLGRARPVLEAPRNLLQFVFLEPAAKDFIVDWQARARRLVAEYRADTAAWRDDPVRHALVHDLGEASAEFAAAWKSQSVQGRDGGRRAFHHPRRGRCEYEQFTLRVAQRAELKLTVLVPL
jgi:transcriptional regulator with XRE-family HTH domain